MVGGRQLALGSWARAPWPVARGAAEVIRGHQRSSEVIRGHTRSYAVISVPVARGAHQRPAAMWPRRVGGPLWGWTRGTCMYSSPTRPKLCNSESGEGYNRRACVTRRYRPRHPRWQGRQPASRREQFAGFLPHLDAPHPCCLHPCTHAGSLPHHPPVPPQRSRPVGGLVSAPCSAPPIAPCPFFSSQRPRK